MKLYRVGTIRPLGGRDRKHVAPVYLVMAEDEAAAVAKVRAEEPAALKIFGVSDMGESAVLWVFHSYAKDEISGIKGRD